MIILALGERKQAFHHLEGGAPEKWGDEVGKTRSKGESKGCHQRDILLLDDTNKQRREMRSTETNRSIVQLLTKCRVRKKINEWENIITAHYTTHGFLWLHYTVIINVGVGLKYEKDVIIAEKLPVCVQMWVVGMHWHECFVCKCVCVTVRDCSM